jgi:hypothetical protein
MAVAKNDPNTVVPHRMPEKLGVFAVFVVGGTNARLRVIVEASQ